MASRYRVFRLVDMAVHEEIFTSGIEFCLLWSHTRGLAYVAKKYEGTTLECENSSVKVMLVTYMLLDWAVHP